MLTETPQIDITHMLAAPRDLAFRVFTDSSHFVAWWGPVGNTLPSSEIEFDIRPGGYQRWTEISAADPRICVQIHVDLTDVIEGELIDGLMHVGGRLPAGIEPFRTRIRYEFSDEIDGRTRLTIRQWLPPEQRGNARRGWSEALAKLDAELLAAQATSSEIGEQ